MAEMASWFKMKGGVAFLTDEDIIAHHENKGTGVRDIDWYDFVGHGGLMEVFRLPDDHVHHEGFVNMPDVIKKTILNGKMDMMFVHAGNLEEATPEFIPTMERLANKYYRVKEALKENPYRGYSGKKLNLAKQMEIGVKKGFKGSTIGELLRHPACNEESFLVALKDATEYMDQHGDHHHYHDILDHKNITKKVLKYVLDNIKHGDVRSKARTRLTTWSRWVLKPAAKIKAINAIKIKTIRSGKAKIRMAV